jgi:hypothetical protein
MITLNLKPNEYDVKYYTFEGVASFKAIKVPKKNDWRKKAVLW